MLWKLCKKNKLNCQMIQKTEKNIVKRYGKYGRMASRIVKRYEKYGRKVGNSEMTRKIWKKGMSNSEKI